MNRTIELWLTDTIPVKVSAELYDHSFDYYDDFNDIFYSLVDGYLKLEGYREEITFNLLLRIEHPPQDFFTHITISPAIWQSIVIEEGERDCRDIPT